MKRFVLRCKETGLYFADWETLGDSPWECRAKWVGLKENARQFDLTETITDWSDTQELAGCKQVEIP